MGGLQTFFANDTIAKISFGFRFIGINSAIYPSSDYIFSAEFYHFTEPTEQLTDFFYRTASFAVSSSTKVNKNMETMEKILRKKTGRNHPNGKIILIPTDFSADAHNAINYAIEMFSGENAEFILLNAYRVVPAGASDYLVNLSDFEIISKQGLKNELEKIKKTFPHKKLNIESVSKLGYPAEVIQKVAKRNMPDMVVMGTKGASGMREALIGSNTSDTIKKLDCPVLAVPENCVFKPPKNIAFAADFKNIDKEVLLKPMIEIAQKFKAELLIVHVEENGKPLNVDEAMQEMRLHEYFEDIPHLFREIKNSNAAEGIENFIQTHTVDLLVTIARKHSFWENLFSGSVTRKLAMHTHVPMLALQEKKK